MAAKKKYDAVVKTGSYTVNGEEKGRYLNVGSVMVNDNGEPFLILNRTFNPAGVPNPDGRDSVIVSFYEPQERSEAPRQAPTQQSAPTPTTTADSIPF